MENGLLFLFLRKKRGTGRVSRQGEKFNLHLIGIFVTAWI
jgi:hypothetical protein